MKYQLKVYTIWEYGQRKDADGNPHQEDCTFPLPNDMTNADRLFILCDGMGGHDAGEVASSTVCEAMGHSILQSQPDVESNFTTEMLQQAIADAFSALDNKDTGAAKKMGTTMTCLKLHNAGCTIAHMGDSRVYHIRPGKSTDDTRILFQTKDHSLVNDLIAIGELTEEEAKHSRQRNVITRAMQPHMEHRPKADVYTTADIQPGDYFYLCSDGMLENMENPQICYNFSEATGTDEEKVTRLIQATQENRDNHTAIIVHILDVTDPIEEKKAAPAKLHPKPHPQPAPLMAKVHENEEEPIDDKNASQTEKNAEKKADADKVDESKNEGIIPEDKQPIPTATNFYSSLPATTKRRPVKWFILIALVTLVIAFALYFLLFAAKEENKDNTPLRMEETKHTEQQIVDNQENSQSQKKTTTDINVSTQSSNP